MDHVFAWLMGLFSLIPGVGQAPPATWNGYAQFTAIQLSNLSHELNGPWDMAFKTQVRFAKISDEQIKQFYAPRVNEYLKQKMIA